VVSPRAREDSMRPRLQSGRVETEQSSSFLPCAAQASGRPLNFTVRSHCRGISASKSRNAPSIDGSLLRLIRTPTLLQASSFIAHEVRAWRATPDAVGRAPSHPLG
jgi:hypothetical protein